MMTRFPGMTAFVRARWVRIGAHGADAAGAIDFSPLATERGEVGNIALFLWSVGRRAARSGGRVVARGQVDLVELGAILAQADGERMTAGAHAVCHGCLHPIPR